MGPARSARRAAPVASSAQDKANELLDTVSEAWDKTEDKTSVVTLATSAALALWIATGVVAYVEKLPFFPFFFEVVGITYSGYFVYRYLLFKPDREELSDKIDEYKGKIGL